MSEIHRWCGSRPARGPSQTLHVSIAVAPHRFGSGEAGRAPFYGETRIRPVGPRIRRAGAGPPARRMIRGGAAPGG
ncbi:hypothetical protein ABZ891_14055 [Streptomyces sp. NPDC047023]|uniref:hypothetical protein n=1 Tax=Streptomyces sp. NPDC047023 TaxID=3155139 RepID=UPI0033D7863F